jgi:uncharacterized protein involved in outer membrane biogenesis
MNTEPGIDRSLLRRNGIMSRNKKIAVIATVILILYSLTGFLAVPYLIQKLLPEKLGKALQRPVSIQAVRFNPYTLSLSVEGFKVMEKSDSKTFLSFHNLFVNVQLSSLSRLGLVIKEITLDKPSIHITRISDHIFNFSDLLEKSGNGGVSKPSEKKTTPPLLFSIHDIQVVDGKIEVEDQVARKTHTISNLSFSLPFISSFKKYHETDAKPELKVRINDTQLTADVQTKPFTDSMETILNLNMIGIDLPRYFDYLPVHPGFILTRGLLDIRSSILFLQHKNRPMFLKVSGTITLSDLELVDVDKKPLIKLAKLDLELAPSKVMEKEILLKKITVSKPEIDIQRDASGNINLLTLVPPSGSSVDPEKPPKTEGSAQPSDLLRLSVDNLSVNDAWIRLKDHDVNHATRKADQKPVETALGPVKLDVTHFSTLPDQKMDFRIHAQVNGKGDIEADGRLGISPISVNGQYAIKDLIFTWIEPYLQDTLKLAITSGRFSSSGKVTVQTDEKKELQADLACNASVEDLKTEDKIKGEDFLQLDGLFLNQVDLSYQPTRITAGEIRIQGLTSQMIVHENGELNLKRILVSKTSPGPESSVKTAEQPSDSPALPITINQVALKDIHVKFLDKQIRPDFSSSIKLSEGTIAGLTSENFQKADVSIHGKIDDYAPIEITGKINPMQDDLFADMEFRLQDMELSPLTPYSGKFIGKTIEKGKLSLDLKYRIEKNTLSAEDKVLFDQLTMGKDMESPDSLNLPVNLVISILKDRKGQIHLDIPVSGKLDDPEFSLKGVILQTIVNIMEKTAASPFTMISGIAGGGEELQFIEFLPGDSEVHDPSRLKLDSIITVLYERPSLKLEMTGYVDDQKDREKLKDRMLDQKIKTRKRMALIQDGLSPAPVEQIIVNADEYPVYVKQVYATEISSSSSETMSLKNMETQIRNNLVVNDSELRLLALNRAKAVKAYILNDKRIEPGRLFLSEAATLGPKQKDQYAAGRVELSLQ